MLDFLRRVFDFNDWAQSHPTSPPPGDMLDAEFEAQNQKINDLVVLVKGLQRDDGKLANGIVTKDSIDPSFFAQISDFFKNQVKQDLEDAESARNVAETRALTATIASDEAKSAAARATSASTIAETGAASLFEQVAAAEEASRALLRAVSETDADFENATRDAEGSAALAHLYADLSSEWAEHMPDTIPPNKLAWMAVSGDHWSSRWWANLAANAFGKMSELYLGAWPNPPTTTSTGGPIPIGGVYYNTTTNQVYVWNGSEWVSFWRPQKAVTASLYYTLASPTTSIDVSSDMDDFGNTFQLSTTHVEWLETYVGNIPGEDGALRLKPYAAIPTSANSGGYWLDVSSQTVLFGAALPAGSLVVFDFLLPPDALRPGSASLWQLRDFDTNPGGGFGYIDGIRKIFQLVRADSGPIAVESPQELLVYVNAVPQQPGIDFHLNTTTEIEFTDAPEDDARVWALWMQPVGFSSGAGIAPPTTPADAYKNYYGWNPTGGIAQWVDARGLVKVVANAAARTALVSGVDIVTGSMVVQQDTRELWIYTGSGTGWRLWLPALPASGTSTGSVLTFNGLAPEWAAGGGGGTSVTISDTAPAGPTAGNMWWQSSSGKLFIYYNDGTSSQFVEIASIASAGSTIILSMFVGGLPAVSEIVFRHEFTRAVTVAAALAGSQGSAAVAATASTVFSIQKNAVQFGTATFAAAGTEPTFAAASSTAFAIGDVLQVMAPASADATLANISISIQGVL